MVDLIKLFSLLFLLIHCCTIYLVFPETKECKKISKHQSITSVQESVRSKLKTVYKMLKFQIYYMQKC